VAGFPRTSATSGHRNAQAKESLLGITATLHPVADREFENPVGYVEQRKVPK
jgi:hypothetical protein